MTKEEIMLLNGEALEARKAELKDMLEKDDCNVDEIRAEIEAIEARTNELVKAENERRALAKSIANSNVTPVSVHGTEGRTNVNEKEERAKEFVRTNKMTIETRQFLAAGALTPTAAKEEVAELSDVISSIVDDVNAFDATGTGAWGYSYRITDAAAADITDGSKIGGTAGTFGKGTITPGEWGVLDEISNQVKKLSPVKYADSIERNAFLALRKKAKAKIVEALLASGSIAQTGISYTLNENFVRNLVLGFDADESVAGGTKLYLCKEDLATLGNIRGSQDKKAVFDITFTDENNGTIQDGGLSVKFSICSDLKGKGASSGNAMLYGQPKTIDMPLWDNYEVSTDEGGDYFQRNMMGIRGIQTAGAALTKYHGMQVINA